MTDTLDLTPAQQFAETVRDGWPGGNHIADHVNDGPWYAVVCAVQDTTKYNSINWLIEDALASYDKHTIVHSDGFDVETQQLYVVPEFVRHLFYHYSDTETDFWVVEDYSIEESFEDKPSQEQLIASMGSLYPGDTDPAVMAALAKKTDIAGLMALLEPLLGQAIEQDNCGDLFSSLLSAMDND